MQSSNEPGNIEAAIKAIGPSKLPLYEAFMDEVQRILVEKGYDEAIVHSEQFFQSTDLNAELVRIMTICRRYNLKPEAAAQVFDYLRRIQAENRKQ
jgi:ferredoxin-NADP reductase